MLPCHSRLRKYLALRSPLAPGRNEQVAGKLSTQQQRASTCSVGPCRPQGLSSLAQAMLYLGMEAQVQSSPMPCCCLQVGPSLRLPVSQSGQHSRARLGSKAGTVSGPLSPSCVICPPLAGQPSGGCPDCDAQHCGQFGEEEAESASGPELGQAS